MRYIIGYAMFCALVLIMRNAFKHPRIDNDEDLERITSCHDCPYWDYCKERLGGERHRDCPAPHLTQKPKQKAKVTSDV